MIAKCAAGKRFSLLKLAFFLLDIAYSFLKIEENYSLHINIGTDSLILIQHITVYINSFKINLVK